MLKLPFKDLLFKPQFQSITYKLEHIFYNFYNLVLKVQLSTLLVKLLNDIFTQYFNQ